MQTVRSEHDKSICCHRRAIEPFPEMFSIQIINNIRPFLLQLLVSLKQRRQILNRNKSSYENRRENDGIFHNVEYL